MLNSCPQFRWTRIPAARSTQSSSATQKPRVQKKWLPIITSSCQLFTWPLHCCNVNMVKAIMKRIQCPRRKHSCSAPLLSRSSLTVAKISVNSSPTRGSSMGSFRNHARLVRDCVVDDVVNFDVLYRMGEDNSPFLLDCGVRANAEGR